MSQKRSLKELQPGARDNQPSLHRLFSDGIPRTEFVRDGAEPSTSHFSDHPPVNDDGQCDLPFGVLEGLNDILEGADRLNRNSLLLTTLDDTEGQLFYSNEAALQTYVGYLLRDILSALGYVKQLEVREEISLTKIKYLGKGGSNRSDFWVVLTSTGRPILIIEVKSPSTPKVLDDLRVYGQALDYMADIMSFFGQFHVFGITTTMQDFRINWFPHSDQYAAATSIPPVVDMPALNRGEVVLNRVLHHSRLVRHDDPELLGMLASAVVKCFQSPYVQVGLIDTSRAFIRLTSTSWNWMRLKQGVVDFLTLDPTGLSAAGPTDFFILKYFFRTYEKKVWLVISQPQNRLVVAKLVPDKMIAAQEVTMWNSVNECNDAFSTVLRTVPAICTPFVIHASKSGADRRVGFDLDISHWIVQHGALPQSLPPMLAEFQDQVRRLGADLDPREIARQAIVRMAELGLQHDDLAWRHIALLPVFHEGGVTALKPALIDFGRVTSGVEPAQARHVMFGKLAELEEDCVWG